MEEAEAGFRHEWEKLDVERLRLFDWERHLGNRIQVVASRATEERARLEQECEVVRENVGRVIDREIAVISQEKAAARKEKEVELKERAARHTIDTAKAIAKMINDKQATLNHLEQDLSLREAAVKEEEDRLSALWTNLGAQTRALESQRQCQEEESQSLSQRLEAFKHREAEVEGLLADQHAGALRIAKWVDEASTALEPLGLSPI
jgi:chromosome segregation ATPase